MAPQNLQQFNGVWVNHNKLSTNPDPILRLQNTSWFIRRAMTVATIHTRMEIHTDTDESGTEVSRYAIQGTGTGGLKAISEGSTLNWTDAESTNYFLGTVVQRARVLTSTADEKGKVRPETEWVHTIADEKVTRFLTGEILPDGSECEGFVVEEDGEGVFLQLFAVNEKMGWKSEHIWGFEMINGKRHYTRRVVSWKEDGQFEMCRVVFAYVKDL